jgi:hypothetical protein
MKVLRALGAFLYDFLIGDDWKIAAGIVIAIGLLALATWQQLFGARLLAVLGGILVLAAFSVSLGLDVRKSAKRK